MGNKTLSKPITSEDLSFIRVYKVKVFSDVVIKHSNIEKLVAKLPKTYSTQEAFDLVVGRLVAKQLRHQGVDIPVTDAMSYAETKAAFKEFLSAYHVDAFTHRKNEAYHLHTFSFTSNQPQKSPEPDTTSSYDRHEDISV